MKTVNKKPKTDRHTRYIYLYVTTSDYGTEIYPYGTYKRATTALRNRMEELFKKNNMSPAEQKPHRERYKIRDSYELAIEDNGSSQNIEYGYIQTQKIL